MRPPSQETKDHLDNILGELADQLMTEKKDFPLTLMYTDTETISYAYRFLEKRMGTVQYVGEDIPENRLFGQYHSEYTEAMKKFIVTEIVKKYSTLRLLFSTVALGMGLDAKYIRHVIHYKPPTSLSKYFQETGRAGRDQQPATATLYYNNTDVRSNRPGITKDMITYCKTESTCLRKVMLSHFGFEDSVENEACCSVCEELK